MRLLVVLAVACCLAGCGGTGKRADALAPVPDDVKRAYLAYWDAWLAANETDAVDDPALDRVAENPNLEVLRAALRAAADRHQVTKGTVRHEIRGMSVEGEAHKVVDCFDIDGWLLYDKDTGAGGFGHGLVAARASARVGHGCGYGTWPVKPWPAYSSDPGAAC